jgi:hypothetical protein
VKKKTQVRPGIDRLRGQHPARTSASSVGEEGRSIFFRRRFWLAAATIVSSLSYTHLPRQGSHEKRARRLFAQNIYV